MGLEHNMFYEILRSVIGGVIAGSALTLLLTAVVKLMIVVDKRSDKC